MDNILVDSAPNICLKNRINVISILAKTVFCHYSSLMFGGKEVTDGKLKEQIIKVIEENSYKYPHNFITAEEMADQILDKAKKEFPNFCQGYISYDELPHNKARCCDCERKESCNVFEYKKKWFGNGGIKDSPQRHTKNGT